MRRTSAVGFLGGGGGITGAGGWEPPNFAAKDARVKAMLEQARDMCLLQLLPGVSSAELFKLCELFDDFDVRARGRSGRRA